MYTEINALCKFHSNNIINIILLRERKKHIHNVSLKKKSTVYVSLFYTFSMDPF